MVPTFATRLAGSALPPIDPALHPSGTPLLIACRLACAFQITAPSRQAPRTLASLCGPLAAISGEAVLHVRWLRNPPGVHAAACWADNTADADSGLADAASLFYGRLLGGMP